MDRVRANDRGRRGTSTEPLSRFYFEAAPDFRRVRFRLEPRLRPLFAPVRRVVSVEAGAPLALGRPRRGALVFARSAFRCWSHRSLT